jgi:hypothetical protein
MRTPISRGGLPRAQRLPRAQTLPRTLRTSLALAVIVLLAACAAIVSTGIASARTAARSASPHAVAHTARTPRLTAPAHSARAHSAKRSSRSSRRCSSTRCRDARVARHGSRAASARAARPHSGHPSTGSGMKTGSGVNALVSSSSSPAATPAQSTTPTPTPPTTPAPVPTPAPVSTPTPTLEPAPSASGWEGFGVNSWPGASWRPYSASSPFNIGVGGASVSPQSAQIVARVMQWNLPQNMTLGVSETTEDFAHPVYYAQPTDPTYTLHATAPWGANSLEGMKIPIPSDARPAGGSDGHMTVVTPDGWEYDFWQVSSKPNGGGTLSFAWGGRLRIDGNGLGGDATAADFGLLAGVIRPQEMEAGEINHALFIVLKCTSAGISFGFGTKAAASGEGGGSYVYPAGKGGSTCSGESEAGVPPMGTWFTLALSDEQIAALAVPAWKKTILRALAHYGGFVGDTGGSGFGVQMESGSSYTSFGETDPWVTFAKKNNLPQWNGHYVMNLSEGVAWQQDLRVLAPPTS